MRCRCLLLILALVGCARNGDPRPEVHPAVGSITVNGEPAVGAKVVLHPADGEDFDVRGTRPTGIVEPNGHFQLTTYEIGDGAPAGEYRVSVMWLGDADSSAPWDKLNRKFLDPAQSGIAITITPESNQLEPIEITGVDVQETRPRPPPRDIDQVE